MKKELPGGYELDDDRARIDLDEVHRFISGESYWAAGRPRDAMRGMIERADRVVGLFHGDVQVGFSRTVDAPDAGLTYLADVYVLPEHRAAVSASRSSASASTKVRSQPTAGCCTRKTRTSFTRSSASGRASGCSSVRAAKSNSAPFKMKP